MRDLLENPLAILNLSIKTKLSKYAKHADELRMKVVLAIKDPLANHAKDEKMPHLSLTSPLFTLGQPNRTAQMAIARWPMAEIEKYHFLAAKRACWSGFSQFLTENCCGNSSQVDGSENFGWEPHSWVYSCLPNQPTRRSQA